MTGAFSSGRPKTSSVLDQDSPQDRPRTAPRTASQGLERTERPGIMAPVLASPGQHVTDPMSVRSNELSAMDKLKSMVAAKMAAPRPRTAGQPSGQTPGQSKTVAPVEPPKGEFKLGVRPTPTGPTAHEIMTQPGHQKSLQDIVAQHEQANPGRSLKAPHLMSMWNAKHPDKPLNEARARTVVAKVKAARDDYVQKQVSSYMRSGAAAALKKS